MAGPLMAPRSYDYSGEVDPRDLRRMGIAEGPAASRSVPASDVSMGTEAPRTGGGFLSRLNELAGNLVPIVDAAVAFKRGYEGYPLPGRSVDDSRMAGDRFIFEVLEDMRARNEASEERARAEREQARQADLQQRLILAGVEKGDISLTDALKAIQSGQFEFPAPKDKLPSQAPASGAP